MTLINPTIFMQNGVLLASTSMMSFLAYIMVEIIFWLKPEKEGGWEGPNWWQASPVCRNWPEREVL